MIVSVLPQQDTLGHYNANMLKGKLGPDHFPEQLKD